MMGFFSSKFSFSVLFLFSPLTALALSFSSPLPGPSSDDAFDTWQRMIPTLDYGPLDCSMVLNDQGYPCISYKPMVGGEGLCYAEYDGTSWQETVVDGSSYTGSGSILLLNPEGLPQIVYYSSVGDVFRYAWYDGSTWQYETCWPDAGNGLDAVLDSQGKVHVLVTDDSNKVHYGTRDGSTWSFEEIGSASNWPIALTVDSSDNPHAVWQTSGYVISYNWYSYGSWYSQTIASANANDLSFTADAYDNLHLVLQGSSSVSYHHKSGSSWEAETIDTMSGDHCSIVVAPDGTVHVAYEEDTNTDLKYAVRSAAAVWQSEVVTWEGYAGQSPTIQLDQYENPWICHSQFSDAEIVWWGSDSTAILNQTEAIQAYDTPITISPNPLYSSGTIQLDIQTPGHYTVSLFDVSGRKVCTLIDSFFETSTHQIPVSGSNLPPGTFFVQLNGEDTCRTERLLIL